MLSDFSLPIVHSARGCPRANHGPIEPGFSHPTIGSIE
jgi:hypothetical protein